MASQYPIYLTPPDASQFPIVVNASQMPRGIRTIEVDNGANVTLLVKAGGQAVRQIAPYTPRLLYQTGPSAWDQVEIDLVAAAVNPGDSLTIVFYDGLIQPPFPGSFLPIIPDQFIRPISLGPNGGIYQGTGTFDNPITGMKIYQEASGQGAIEFWANGSLIVREDSNGLTFFVSDTQAQINPALAFQTLLGVSLGFLHLTSIPGTSSQVELDAEGLSGEAAVDLLLRARAIGQPAASLDLISDGAGARAVLVGNVQMSGPDPWYDVRFYGAKGDGITDDTAAIHAARDAAGANGYLFLPNGTYLTTGLTANQAGQTWVCAAGATIKQANGANAQCLTVTADDVTIDGGIWDGNQTNQTSGQAILVRALRTTIRNAYVKSGYNYTVRLAQGVEADKGRIINCHILHDSAYAGGMAVFGNVGASDWLIQGNLIEVTSSAATHCIAFHSTSPGANVFRQRIIGNRLETPGGFGVEIGAFGGDTPYGCVVADNVIVATGNSNGGISLSGCNDSTVSGNIFDQNGFASVTAGIEIVGCLSCSIVGNIIRGGSTFNGVGAIDLDQSSLCTVQGNTIDGFGNGATYGIIVTTSAASDAGQNSIVGNAIYFPQQASGSSAGIFLQANFAGQHVDRNLIVGNIITGPGSSVANGIKLSQFFGTLDRTLVIGNQITNVANAVIHSSDTNTWMTGNQTSGVTTTDAGVAGAGLVRIANPGMTANQTVTGSRAGNAALASLLTALANANVVVDNTTA